MTNKIIDVSSTSLDITFMDDGEDEAKYNAELEALREINSKLIFLMDEFLNNLKANPDKATIKWPSRVEDVEKFQKQLQEINKGK